MKEIKIEEKQGEKQRQKFLRLFYQILDNPENQHLIKWHENGFIILNVEEFKNTLLPQNFRHNNYQSLMRQLNKYGFKIKSKENTQAIFTHPTIRSDNRETKRVLGINKNLQKLDHQKELKLLKSQLDNLKKGQALLKQQLSISIQIMIKLQKYYSRLSLMTFQTVGFANIFGNLLYSNHKRIWGNVTGELFSMQLKSIAQGFPELLENNLLTPIQSNFGTPLPFYQFLGQMKEFSNLILH